MLGESENADAYIQNLIIDSGDGTNPQQWFDYAKFCLQYDKSSQAELFMNKYIEAVGCDEDMSLMMGALYLQDKQYAKAQRYLHSVLAQNWDHIHANVLIAFIYEAINRPGLSRKHFAIAKVKRMREIGGYLHPKNNDPKNFRREGVHYQVDIVNYTNVVTKDQAIKPEDSDQIFFELIDRLLKNNLYKAANMCLGYLKDEHSH